MTAELTTVIGQLSIVEGSWRNEAPNQVAVREPTSADNPGAGKGALFVLVEVRARTGAGESLERQLAKVIQDSYYLASGSTTASLRRAMQAAGDLLYQYNTGVEVEERVIGGAVAMVVNGEDAFVARLGPTACFAILGDHVRRYPSQSVWLDEVTGPNQKVQEPALGLRAVVEPHLHHLRLSPEDRLVLADSGLAGQLPIETVVKAVDGGDVKRAIKNLGKAAQAKTCSALVLDVVEQAEQLPGPLKVVAPPRLSRLFRRSTPAPAAEAPVPSAPSKEEPEPVLAEGDVAGAPAAEQTATGWSRFFSRKRESSESLRDESQPGPATPAPSRPSQTKSRPKDYANLKPQTGQRAKVLTSAVHEQTFATQLRQPPAEKDHPSRPERYLQRLSVALLTVVALFGRSLKAIFGRFDPNTDPHGYRQAGMQAQRPRSATFISWTLLRNIALLIPLLVAVIVGVSYLQKGRMQESQYQDLVAAAQSKFEQAQAVDRNSALALIAEANALLVQAEQIKPDQPVITDLRLQMAETADTLANVQRLYYLPQLRQYTDPNTVLEEIIVQGVEIYVMDVGNGRVYHHQLDDLGESLLADDDTLLLVAQGQVVDDITVGELLGMTWMPTGGNRQTSDLVILTSNGLFEYHPNWGITAASFSAGESLVRPVAISSFFGNLYLLDPQGNVLLRYLPTEDGYSAPPENYFTTDQPVDLSGAVDFAIDGAIYVLFQDGRIQKYLSGEPVEFNVSGLDVPFNNPVSIFTAPNEEVQYLYVADAGHQRIVQLNKDGSFVRQFKARPGEAVSFANLQDIYVDELGARLYVLDSNNLYVGNIPNE